MLNLLGLFSVLLGLASCASSSPGDQSTPESNANFALGVAAYSASQYPSALEYFTRAEKLAPENPSYEMHVGLALMSLERYPEAEKKLLHSCGKTQYPDCWNNLSVFYLTTKRPSESLVFSKKAAESANYQTPEVALANQARALIQLKRYSESLDALKKAERIGSPSCVVSLLKAQTLNRLKYYDAALDSAKRAESQCSSDARSHFWVAYLYQKSGHTDLTEKKFKSMLETFRDQKTVFETNKYLEQLEKRIPLKEPQI